MPWPPPPSTAAVAPCPHHAATLGQADRVRSSKIQASSPFASQMWAQACSKASTVCATAPWTAGVLEMSSSMKVLPEFLFVWHASSAGGRKQPTGQDVLGLQGDQIVLAERPVPICEQPAGLTQPGPVQRIAHAAGVGEMGLLD